MCSEVEGKLRLKEVEGVSASEEAGRTIVTAVGKGAHGSTPQLGVNAAKLLFEAVQAVKMDEDFCEMVRFVREKLADSDGRALGIYYEDEETGKTTVNLGIVRGNEKELSLTLDIRYPKSGDREQIVDQVKTCAEAYGFCAELESEGRLLYLPKDSELVRKLRAVYREQTGTDPEPEAIGGGTSSESFSYTHLQ